MTQNQRLTLIMRIGNKLLTKLRVSSGDKNELYKMTSWIVHIKNLQI